MKQYPLIKNFRLSLSIKHFLQMCFIRTDLSFKNFVYSVKKDYVNKCLILNFEEVKK